MTGPTTEAALRERAVRRAQELGWNEATARDSSYESWIAGYIAALRERPSDAALVALAREYRKAQEAKEDAIKNPPPSSADHYTRVERYEAAQKSLDAALAAARPDAPAETEDELRDRLAAEDDRWIDDAPADPSGERTPGGAA